MDYSPEQLAKIASQIRQAIDDYCLVKFAQEPRKHLGASEIGEDCLFRLWMHFRWIKRKTFEARMYRLFNRGHNEEPRYIEWLQAAGFEVRPVNPETGEQYLFSDIDGHYGGSTDGLAMHHTLMPGELLICEFKTHNDKYFQALLKRGLLVEQPKHYAQMSAYGERFGASYGVYCAANKDDDDLHIEIVPLDWGYGKILVDKARYIIRAESAPPRINNASPSFYYCKMCEGMGVCFRREPADRNCRSCRFAVPIEGAQWGCNRWNGIIPEDFIPKGCGEYKTIL